MSAGFDETNVKYQCCCGLFHFKTVISIFRGFLIATCILHLFVISVAAINGDPIRLYAPLIVFLILGIDAFSLSMALETEKCGWLIIYFINLVIKGLSVIILCAAFIFGMEVIMQSFSHEIEEELGKKVEVVGIVTAISVCLVSLSLMMWHGYIIRKYYIYLSDKRKYKQTQPTTVFTTPSRYY